jgi:esterase
MGGKAAMLYSLLHPTSVDRLVVLDIAPVSYAHNHDDRFEAMKSVPLDKITSKQEAAKYLAKYFPSKPGKQWHFVQN